jgi:hypothetical protein
MVSSVSRGALAPEKENDPPMKDSSSSGPVGARHDDSSLFSLDALKKTEDEARTQKNRDDSGLIDLKALASLAQERPKAQEMSVAAVVAPPDLFAVAAPIAPMVAPPVATAAPEDLAPFKPKRTGLYVGVGGVVAVLAMVGIFLATRGSGDAAAAATTTAAAPPPPAVTAAPAPTPDEPRVAAVNPGERPPKEDPKAAPTATTAPAAVAAPKPVVRGPLPKPPPKEEAPAPKPAGPVCDLACQMAKAVNQKK